MLRNVKKLERCELRARDGKIGHVDDFLFDDRQWTIRYLVADTGHWLESRRVLISPAALAAPEFERHMMPVNLMRDQVRHSPPVDSVYPLSREQELLLTQYYSWPAYWSSAGFADPGFVPPMVPLDFEAAGGGERGRFPARPHADNPGSARTVPAQDEPHVRSIRNVSTFNLEATDGPVGHVDDFLVDDRTWEIRYVVVATRNWLPGKKVLVAPAWIEDVDWNGARVQVSLTRAAIKASPPYDPSEPLSSEYTSHLHEYYGRPRHSGS